MSEANPANRSGLQLALHTSIKKQAILVVHSLSCLAWNTKEIIKMTERLRHAKADIISIPEEIDTTKDYGQYFFKTAELFVNFEGELASERTSNSMIREQKAGRRMSYLPPYGQMLDPKDSTKLIVNAEEQRAITRMLELHKEGASFRCIARQLLDEGYEARRKPREFKGRIVYVKGKWRGDLIARVVRRELHRNLAS